MNKRFDFENLEVYQKAIEYGENIFEIFEKFPFSIQKALGDNLLRASMSIGANIAEGSGRRSKKEKRHHFEISQGSAFECIPILTVLYKKKKISKEIFEKLYDECCVISKMLSGLISYFSG